MTKRKPNAAERRLLRALAYIAKISRYAATVGERATPREVYNIAHEALVENLRNRVSS